jgi:hypothetical protein
MKHLLTSILLSVALSVLAVTPTGLGLGNVATLAVATPPAAGGSFLVNQGFEGTGYDNGETWTGSSVDPDYTGVVLAGSQSLQLVTTGTVANAWVSFTGQDAVYSKLLLYVVSTPGTNQVFATIRNGTTVLASFTIAGANRNLRATAAGGGNATSSGVMPTGTPLYVWLEYVKGTGSNAIARAGWRLVSDGDFKPALTSTGAQTAISTGSATSQGDRWYIGHTNNTTNEIIVDTVQISGSAF